jgi:hypothetical protein
VADIKKSVWTTPDGPDSLQIHAYGRAFAKKTDCVAYCTGIWAAKEGRWIWSTEIVLLDGPSGQATWERIAHAASNTGEASTGSHCGSCYARLHCAEYLLPAVVASALATEVASGGLAADADAARLLAWADRAEDLAGRVRDNLKEQVRRGLLTITNDDGKVWSPVEMPASSFTVNKKAHVQMRWKKAR